MAPALEQARFVDLVGFADDDIGAAFVTFLRSAKALAEGAPPTRPGLAPSAALMAAARDALSLDSTGPAAGRAFFEQRFQPWRVRPHAGAARGFLTGYYEPRLRGSLEPSEAFHAPVLGRPDDLVAFAAGEAPPSFDPALSGAQRLPNGALRPYPDRAAIEAGGAG